MEQLNIKIQNRFSDNFGECDFTHFFNNFYV